MSRTPFTIWCNTKFAEPILYRLKSAVAPHRLVIASAQQASNLIGADRDPVLADADIALGQPNPDQVLEIPRIKWVHLTTAGYTRYDTPAFREGMKSRGGILTNSSDVYDEPCAEHLLAMMLALARQLPVALLDQHGSRAWPYLPIRARSCLLTGQSAILYGYGAIADRLVELLQPFGMNLIGVRRKPQGDEPIRVVTVEEADRLLPESDHVVNILPASDQTEGFFDAARLARLKPSAIYYSVGRGSTTDQEALRSALEAKTIAAAYLDVTTPEPLPPDHPLWRAPNCFITPHTAGGHTTEFERLADHFVANLKRYETGESLVDWVI
ncbi:MAG: D-2-hydroxyacid dehydrogenase [Tepidisphaeraceae bacterium]